MIQKIIILLSLLLIVIIIIYNSTHEYIKEHMGIINDIGSIHNFYNPNLIDPVIFNKSDSYDMGMIVYGSPYDDKKKMILPTDKGNKGLTKEVLLQKSKDVRALNIKNLIVNIQKDEDAIEKLKLYTYPKIASIAMILTSYDPSASWEIITEVNKIEKDTAKIETYFKDKLKEYQGYYDDTEIKNISDEMYQTLQTNLTKNKKIIEDYKKTNNVEPTTTITNIGTTTTIGTTTIGTTTIGTTTTLQTL